MEEFNQNLNSNNVFLQSQAFCALTEAIKQDAKDINIVYESLEVKKLWQIVNEGDFGIATLAVETLITLVTEGLLPAPATMQNFIADATSAKSPTAILRGITHLLILICEAGTESSSTLSCPFTGPPIGPSHPYVLLITRRPQMTIAVLEEINFLLFHPQTKIQNGWLCLLQPPLFHIYCFTDTSIPIANPLIDLLVSSHKVLGRPLIQILCRLTSLTKVHSKSHIERKLIILRGLAIIALEVNEPRLLAALLPCLVISLPHAIKHGLSTRTSESHIMAIALKLKQGCDVTICALAEVLSLTAGELQVNLLRMGVTLLSHKDGNPVVASRVMPSLLQVLSTSTSSVSALFAAASTLVSLIQTTPAHISSNAQLSGNEYWEMLSLSFPDLATFIPTIELCNQIVKDQKCAAEWLTNLSRTVHLISKFHYSIVTAVFLYQGSTSQTIENAANVLEREVVKNKIFALELFPIVLYRLGREPNPITKLRLLYFLPSLAVNKLCVAMILKTLLALWSSSSLKPLILRLLLEVWKVEPRVYPYLSQLINDKAVTTQDLEVTRAYVVYSVCKARPSQHGEELLSLLSGFLNESRGKDGTAQTMIAIDGIYELCFATVIDLRTTWQVIAPKLVKDKRPEVIVKLCNLLSLTSKLEVKSKEYEEFTSGVATILWGWASSKIKNCVNEAAFRALEMFDVSHFQLRMLPPFAKQGHKLPDKMASTPFEAARKAEDVLSYVPGLAWVKLATGSSKSHLKFVESFIKSVLEKEVTALPKGIYMTAIQEAKRRGCKGSGGKPEPPNYSFLPETSCLRAFITFLQDFSKLLNDTSDYESADQLIRGLNIILDALGQPLNRPFPALDWSFLHEVLNAYEKWQSANSREKCTNYILHGVFKVTAQQCNKSASALSVISKWLTSSASLSHHDQLKLLEILDQLGRGLNPTLMQNFLNNIFSEAIKSKVNLKLFLEAIKPHLTCNYIHDSNRNVISNSIENLNEKIDPTDAYVYDAYKSCVADLPLKHIERLTSPSLWWEITDEKLLRAAVLRCHVASTESKLNALTWLNDLVDSAAALPGDRSHILLVMADTLVIKSEAEESSIWLLSLLGRLRDHLKNQPGDNLVLIHEQQQRIIFYMDLLLISLLIWSGLWASCSLDKLASSQFLRNTLLCPSLVALHGRPDWSHALPQLLNWFVSSFPKLEQHVEGIYDIKSAILLLASLSDTLSQAMWNKVVSMFI